VQKVIFFLLLTTQLFSNQYLEELYTLSPKQQNVLKKTFKKGKVYNLGYTLTAICWEESQFGKYMVNISDPSFGYFHNSVRSIQRRYRANNWNTSRLIERLLYDYDFGFQQALIELQFWQKVYAGQPLSWSKTVSSYNAGYRHENGKRYLEKIKLKIRALRLYEGIK